MKERLDILLVERRLVESRTKAQWLIRNGFVVVNKSEITKPGKKIDNTSDIQLKKEFPYVGRGGLKLEAALREFSISVEGKICADIGASIGGFTDCLLKHGALKVYAIDNATDLLHPSLKCKPERVIALLGVDARELDKLEEDIDICTIDVTFTSLKSILPNVKEFLKINGDIIALIKPLFETEFYEEKKFKIIQNPDEINNILLDLMEWSIKSEIFPYSLIKSPLLGKGGSVEFLIHYKVHKKNPDFDYKNQIMTLITK